VRSKRAGILSGAVALSLMGSAVWAQGTPAAAPSGLQTGPATVATHWSKNKYPTSIPDGASYYIVVRGDTLWDISQRFLGNPFLWPQIWNQNKYITDAHWIYPGDPILVPKVSVVSEKAGEAGATGTAEGEGAEGAAGEGGAGAGGAGSALYAVTEEVTMQCAPYIVSSHEDESLQLIGSEHGATKVSFSERDILYLAKGTNAGIKAGDVFTFHHRAYPVKHPSSGKTIGDKVETTGWGRVILVQENSSTLVVDQACGDIHLGDYLKPFEKLNVPLSLRRPIADRLTPATGKAQGYVVDIADNVAVAATGQLVSIDIGSESGIAPGNALVVYRTMYPSVPTPRNVLGELAVLTVREKTATAKVINSNDAMMIGDQVELR
jgi:LysM repeat protein